MEESGEWFLPSFYHPEKERAVGKRGGKYTTKTEKRKDTHWGETEGGVRKVKKARDKQKGVSSTMESVYTMARYCRCMKNKWNIQHMPTTLVFLCDLLKRARWWLLAYFWAGKYKNILFCPLFLSQKVQW